MNPIWLAIGSNSNSTGCKLAATICHVTRELSHHDIAIVSHSGYFRTPPMGPVRQPAYINAVIEVRGSIGPAALLRLVKRIEWAAGRRAGVRWGPRPLDIDILDHGGRILGHPSISTRRGTLSLPHPGIADRGFVLVPLEKIAPAWRHPILGIGARALLARRPQLRRGIIELREMPVDNRRRAAQKQDAP